MKKVLYTQMSMAVMTAAIVVCMPACADKDAKDAKNITFTLAKASSKSFTISVDGADWNWSMLHIGGVSTLSYDGLTRVSTSNVESFVTKLSFDWTINGKVITATLKSGYSRLNGTLKFDNNGSGRMFCISAWNDTDGGTDANYEGKPAQGITFP
jgi:hypothetical protein